MLEEDHKNVSMLCAKSEGKTALPRPACVWVGHIKMTLKRGDADVNWFHLVQKRIHSLVMVKTVKNLGDQKRRGISCAVD